MLLLSAFTFSFILAPPAPQFNVQTTEPTPGVGTVKSLAKDGTLQLSAREAAVPGDALLSLRRVDLPLPAWPRGSQVILSNGSRLSCIAIGGSADDLDVMLPGHTQTTREVWSVPILSLAAVWMIAPPADLPPDPIAYPWVAAGSRRDTIRLRNGDILRGLVEGFTAKPAVRIKPDDGPARELELDRVAAIVFNPALARPRKPKGRYFRLVTTNGSRIALRSAVSDGSTLSGVTFFGGKVELPLDEVVALDVMLGRATYLSDMKPKAAATSAYLDLEWPWKTNRSVRGKPLRLRGPNGTETYDRGLGTHSRTKLDYAVPPKQTRFEATVGLDADSGRRGAVALRVLLDDKEVWRVDRLAAADQPVILSIPLNGAKVLSLIVDYGPGGDVQDDVNWCDARFVE